MIPRIDKSLAFARCICAAPVPRELIWFSVFQGAADLLSSKSCNTSDTWIPNISPEPLPGAPSLLEFREYFVILLMVNVDPRQSTVTSLSSLETGVAYLIVIEIAGFSEVGKLRGSTWGRVTGFPPPSRPRVRRGPEAGARDLPSNVDLPSYTPDMMMVWTILGFQVIPGAAVIVGPQLPSSRLPIL